jgi:hypothetical protein
MMLAARPCMGCRPSGCIHGDWPKRASAPTALAEAARPEQKLTGSSGLLKGQLGCQRLGEPTFAWSAPRLKTTQTTQAGGVLWLWRVRGEGLGA